jgi:hypothetical protein
MNTRPTPETDEEFCKLVEDANSPTAKCIQQLERERDEAREVLREIRDNEVNPEDEADRFLRDHAPSELSKVREQRDRLAEAIREYTRGNHPESFLLKALQSLTPNDKDLARRALDSK